MRNVQRLKQFSNDFDIPQHTRQCRFVLIIDLSATEYSNTVFRVSPSPNDADAACANDNDLKMILQLRQWSVDCVVSDQMIITNTRAGCRLVITGPWCSRNRLQQLKLESHTIVKITARCAAKVNKHPHLHQRSRDSRLTQFYQTLWT